GLELMLGVDVGGEAHAEARLGADVAEEQPLAPFHERSPARRGRGFEEREQLLDEGTERLYFVEVALDGVDLPLVLFVVARALEVSGELCFVRGEAVAPA